MGIFKVRRKCESAWGISEQDSFVTADYWRIDGGALCFFLRANLEITNRDKQVITFAPGIWFTVEPYEEE